jgi:uncharacterized protein (TIGR03083 family)
MTLSAGSGRAQSVPAAGDYLVQLESIGEHITGLISVGRLDATVPSCPGWTLTHLLRHLGATYLWATEIVGDSLNGRHRDMFGRSAAASERAEALAGEAVIAWFSDNFAAMIETLSAATQAARPDYDCWTFMPDRSGYDFWARRQAHESAIHGIDVQLALGPADEVAPVPPWFARDGVDEMLTGFVARPGAALRLAQQRTFAVRSLEPDLPYPGEDDPPTPDSWLVTVGPEAIVTQRNPADDVLAAAEATMTAAPHDLYAVLWNRPSIGPVTVDGDAELIDAWHREVRIR